MSVIVMLLLRYFLYCGTSWLMSLIVLWLRRILLWYTYDWFYYWKTKESKELYPFIEWNPEFHGITWSIHFWSLFFHAPSITPKDSKWFALLLYLLLSIHSHIKNISQGTVTMVQYTFRCTLILCNASDIEHDEHWHATAFSITQPSVPQRYLQIQISLWRVIS